MHFINRHHALITALCFSLGLIVAYHFLRLINPFLLQLGFVISLALLFLTYFSLNKLFYPLALVTIFLGGLSAGLNHFAFFPNDHLLLKDWKKATAIKGWISQAEYRKDGRHRYRFECQALLVDSLWEMAHGKVLLYLKGSDFQLKYGQQLLIKTKLELPPLPANPGDFNYRRYLNFQDIFFQARINEDQLQIIAENKGNFFVSKFLIPLRKKIRTIIQNQLPEPTSDLVQALILGERQNLDRRLYSQFQRTGIVHVLAISGLHVGFVLLVFVLLFGLFPVTYRQKYLMAFLFLALFVALVNFKAPVVRASLMAMLYFCLKEWGRRPSGLNILGLAAFIILLFDPDQLFQPGFQFSFAAVSGILFGYPHLRQLFPWKPQRQALRKLNQWIVQPLLVSLAAVLATLPLTWWYYGAIQTGAVFINLIIIPLMGMIVILSLLLVLLGFFQLPVLTGLGWLIHLIFMFVKAMIGQLAKWPFVQSQVGHPSLVLVLLVCLLIFYLYQIHDRKSWSKIAVLLLLIVLTLNSNHHHPLRLIFVNVGQGDGCLVQLPDGNNILIDGGENRPWFNAGERYLKPLLNYFAIRRIKYVIATHAHTDHFGGFLTVLRQFKVDTLVVNTYPDKTKSYLQLLALAKQNGIPIKTVKRGQMLNAGQRLRCYILHPYGSFSKLKKHNGSEVNNSSVVLKLSFGQTAFLFTGDAQKQAEQALQSYGPFLHSSVLKVGHHGSSTSTSEDFLNLVTPQFAVISVGKQNKFGHPSKIILSRLGYKKIPVLRTDHFGAIIFESNGQEIKLVNWRKWLN